MPTDQTTETCTIVADFLGILLDPCGLDATHTAAGHCEHGHTRTRSICTNHAQAFEALPDAVACEQCAQAGIHTPMALLIEEVRRAH